MPELMKPNGRLTSYGFACGYMESRWVGQRATRLYMEHNVYFVTQYHHGIGQSVAWETYRTLTEARKAFSRLAKRVRTENTVFSEYAEV